MKIFVFVILFIIFEIAVFTFFAPQENVVEMINKERRITAEWMGVERTTQMIERADAIYKDTFLNTGIVKGTFQIMGVDDPSKNNMWLSTGIYDKVVERINTFWLLVKAGLMRIEVMLVYLAVSLLFLIPIVVDGFVIREIRKQGASSPSTNIYTAGKDGLYICLAIPVFFLIWPFTIYPAYMVLWTLSIGVCCWLLSAHFQHFF